jgi:cytochrome c peroxidase
MKKYTILSVLSLFVMFIFNTCNKDNELVKDDTPYQLNYGNFPAPQIAQDNPLTIQGVALGRKLFYESALSKDGSQMCATCHVQENAFTDLDQFSTGVDGFLGGRQSMAIFNMAWHENEFFWDGRAHLLRDQALLPIQDSLELNETLDNVIAKLQNLPYYKDQFVRAFGSEEITALKISLALEQFMLTIVSNNSKYDKYLAGEVALSASELRGEELFFAEYNEFFPNVSGADCAHCHGGFNFENDDYMNNGLDIDADFEDLGRFNATGDPADNAKFKVPSLRNIELTPPYMHDGRFTTLEEVVEHYNSGIHNSSTVDPTVLNTQNTGLMLSSQDKADLVAFLKTLTDQSITTDPAFSDPN